MMTKKKIDSLTDEQWQMMREYREEMRVDALRTDTINPDEARKSINELYTAGGFEPPHEIFILKSPLQCLMARDLCEKLFKDKTEIDRARVEREIAKADITKARVTNQSLWFIGGWDNFWIAFYDFATKIGVTYKPETQKLLDAYKYYARSCGVAYLYKDVAFVSDRSETIKFDAQRRLHCDDGPSVRWRDGFSIYTWRGLRIPRELIEDRHKIKPKEILKMSNAELRRVAMEIYAMVHGADQFIKGLGAKLLTKDENFGHPRRIYEVANQKFLFVTNGSLEPDGSRRKFILGANPDAITPHDAVAVSYGRPSAKYREAVRT
jgi:hypothetical protein